MKKLTGFLLLAATLLACNSTPGNSPKSTVASFIEAAKKGNIEDLKKYLTQEDVSLMAMGEAFLAKLDPAKAKEMKDKMASQFRDKTKDVAIDIKDEKIEGDNATVNVEFNSNGKMENHPFSLQKEEGVWKISLLSTGMSGSGMSKEKMEENMSKMRESMKNLDGLSDSLSRAMDELKKLNTDSIKKLMESGNAELEKLKETLKKEQH